MIKGIIIGILIYSFIITIADIYKDSSSYFQMDEIDAVLAGPFMWILLLFCAVCRKLFGKKIEAARNNREKKPYVKKSQKYIQKVVKSIVHNLKKRKRDYISYYDLSTIHGCQDYDTDIDGWEDLLVKKPSNEHINRKFSILMFHQSEDTINELKNYFELATKEFMQQDECSEYFIRRALDRQVYVLKKDS